MAATVATVAGVNREFTGSYIETLRTVTGDSSTYAAGGYPITAASLGLHSVKKAVSVIISGFGSGFAHADPLVQTDGSLKLRLRAAAGTEVADGVDAHLVVVRLIVKGTGA
jgi:hypothetical protein